MKTLRVQIPTRYTRGIYLLDVHSKNTTGQRIAQISALKANSHIPCIPTRHSPPRRNCPIICPPERKCRDDPREPRESDWLVPLLACAKVRSATVGRIINCFYYYYELVLQIKPNIILGFPLTYTQPFNNHSIISYITIRMHHSCLTTSIVLDTLPGFYKQVSFSDGSPTDGI